MVAQFKGALLGIIFVLIGASQAFAGYENLSTQALLQEAKAARIQVREKLKASAERLDLVQVLKISGSMSGLFTSGAFSGAGSETIQNAEWYELTTTNVKNLGSMYGQFEKYRDGEYTFGCTPAVLDFFKEVGRNHVEESVVQDIRSVSAQFVELLNTIDLRPKTEAESAEFSELANWGRRTLVRVRVFNLPRMYFSGKFWTHPHLEIGTQVLSGDYCESPEEAVDKVTKRFATTKTYSIY